MRLLRPTADTLVAAAALVQGVSAAAAPTSDTRALPPPSTELAIVRQDICRGARQQSCQRRRVPHSAAAGVFKKDGTSDRQTNMYDCTAESHRTVSQSYGSSMLVIKTWKAVNMLETSDLGCGVGDGPCGAGGAEPQPPQ